MKTIKLIPCGSRIFFSHYPDYVEHDKDYIAIVDGLPNDNLSISRRKRDTFFVEAKPIDEVMEDARNWNKRITWLGRFLVPEHNEIFGFTVEHLKEIAPKFDLMPPSHQYEKIICDAYIENGSFTLTDEQRLKAYESYKSQRPAYGGVCTNGEDSDPKNESIHIRL